MIADRPAPDESLGRAYERSFAVVGDVSDRKGFVDAIRSLALIKRFGDRLTLIGYGRHRRCLEKWASALQIGHRLVFGAQAPGGAIYDEHDVVITFDQARGTVMLSTCGVLLTQVNSGDLVALTHAMMITRADLRSAGMSTPEPTSATAAGVRNMPHSASMTRLAPQ